VSLLAVSVDAEPVEASLPNGSNGRRKKQPPLFASAAGGRATQAARKLDAPAAITIAKTAPNRPAGLTEQHMRFLILVSPASPLSTG